MISAPKTSNEVVLSFPVEHVLLITLNRPKSLNAMTPTMSADMMNVLDWFDDEAALW
jgi:enoyl-CoA hydratase/carnithine racemase